MRADVFLHSPARVCNSFAHSSLLFLPVIGLDNDPHNVLFPLQCRITIAFILQNVSLFSKASVAAQDTAAKAANEFRARDWLLPWLMRSRKVKHY